MLEHGGIELKRFIFLLAYALSPVVPIAIYLVSIGGRLDSYTLSVALGIYAFIMICNQLILASKPAAAVSALGPKGTLALHGTAPFVILAIAGTHRLLKSLNGFPDDSFQATFGAAAWWVFMLAAFMALALMANVPAPLGDRLRELRSWVTTTFRLTYKTARIFHNVTVVACLAILVHVMLASSSSPNANPVGIAWMAGWMALSIGLYIRYRLRGRPVPERQ